MLDTYGRQAAGWRKPGPEERALGLFTITRIAERALGDAEFRNPPRGHHTHLIVLASAHAAAGEPGAPAATTAEGHTIDPGLLAAMQCTTTGDILISDTLLPDSYTMNGTTPDSSAPTAGADTGPSMNTAGPVAWPTDGELLQRALTGLSRGAGRYRLEPLAYGRAKRRGTQAIYDALIARDHGCVINFCERGPTWTDIHHLLEHAADDGPTDIEALALVCYPHHNHMHRLGQHLHPPWCHCDYCERLQEKSWRLRSTLPVITPNPRVLRYEPFGQLDTRHAQVR